MADATVTIDKSMGKMPSAPIRIVLATVDATNITSYATGGFAIAALTAELVGLTWYSVPMADHDGTSTTRWFQVTGTTAPKVQGYTAVGLDTEVTATTDISAHTAIQVIIFAY